MTVSKSTRKKPSKPRRNFPLYAHPSGQWAKSISGRKYYFGPWSDPDAAERLYDQQKHDLLAGRQPRPLQDGLTVRDLCNSFLESKELQVSAGELAHRTWVNCRKECQLAVKVFGPDRLVSDLHPEDFRRVKRDIVRRSRSPLTLRTEIKIFRSIFNYARDNKLVETAVVFGSDFRPPSKETLRKYRNDQRKKHGKRMFTPVQCRRLIREANPAMRAMILLALNCGCNNKDVRALTFADIDLEKGWLDFPRAKTGQDRVAKLWPETIAAIQKYLRGRQQPSHPDYSTLVFLTRRGRPYGYDDTPDRKGSDSLCAVFRVYLDRLGIRKPGLSWLLLRHTYRTFADETNDVPAINLTMGHVDDTMGATYREEINRKRLFKVAKHVRWKLLKSGRKPR